MICLDEMGPQSAKSIAGQKPVHAPEPDKPAERARQEIDYGRRGSGYIFGAFRPATGEAFTRPYGGRTIASWVDFLEQTDQWLPADAERVYAVLDNLSAHRAADVLLFSLAHPRWEFVFQPVCAAYLNLIEPWWKTLRSLALKGRRFETWDEIAAGGRGGDGLLERAPSSVRLGAQAPPPAQAQGGAGPVADSGLNFCGLTGCTTKCLLFIVQMSFAVRSQVGHRHRIWGRNLPRIISFVLNGSLDSGIHLVRSLVFFRSISFLFFLSSHLPLTLFKVSGHFLGLIGRILFSLSLHRSTGLSPYIIIPCHY